MAHGRRGNLEAAVLRGSWRRTLWRQGPHQDLETETLWLAAFVSVVENHVWGGRRGPFGVATRKASHPPPSLRRPRTV